MRYEWMNEWVNLRTYKSQYMYVNTDMGGRLKIEGSSAMGTSVRYRIIYAFPAIPGALQQYRIINNY